MAEEVKPIKTERIDNSDGTYTVKEIYDKPKDNFTNGKFLIYLYDRLDRVLNLKIYSDIQKQLLFSESIYCYYENGNYDLKILCQDKNIFTIQKFNKDDCLLEKIKYADKTFRQQIWHVTYEYNEKYRKEFIICAKDKYNSQIDVYDENDRIIFSTYYSDNKFSNFYAEEKYNYNLNGSYTKTIIMTEPIRECLSAIKYYDVYGKEYKSIAYEDNSCKVILYNAKIKQINNSTIFFKCYKNNTIITKYDKNGTLVYNKENKFKLVAHILFWLAR